MLTQDRRANFTITILPAARVDELLTVILVILYELIVSLYHAHVSAVYQATHQR